MTPEGVVSDDDEGGVGVVSGHVRSLSVGSTFSDILSSEALHNFYKQYPDAVFSGEAEEAETALRASGARLEVRPKLPSDCPKGMDHGMFAARCHCEEGVVALKKLADLGAGSMASDCANSLSNTCNFIRQLQDKQRKNTTEVIEAFLPNDFRKSLFKREKQRREKYNEHELKGCLAKGGSVRDKYEILWRQQNARRELLGSIGGASGIFRRFIATLSGVPEALLRVARDINKPGGPTEAVRVKFHPTLERLVLFSGLIANTADAILKSVTSEGRSGRDDVLDEVERVALVQVSHSSLVLHSEVTQFVTLLDKVIEQSPFTLNPENVKKLLTKK